MQHSSRCEKTRCCRRSSCSDRRCPADCNRSGYGRCPPWHHRLCRSARSRRRASPCPLHHSSPRPRGTSLRWDGSRWHADIPKHRYRRTERTAGCSSFHSRCRWFHPLRPNSWTHRSEAPRRCQASHPSQRCTCPSNNHRRACRRRQFEYRTSSPARNARRCTVSSSIGRSTRIRCRWSYRCC